MPLGPITGCHRRDQSLLLYFPLWECSVLQWGPASVSSRLNRQGDLSCSLFSFPLSPFTILVALFGEDSLIVLYLKLCTQNCTQDSRLRQSRAGQSLPLLSWWCGAWCTQDTVGGPLVCVGTADTYSTCHQSGPRGAALQCLVPQSVCASWVDLSQVQNPATALVKLYMCWRLGFVQFFFLGNFSPICCLRDQNNGYLRETKDVCKMGGRAAAGCSLLAGVLSFGRSWDNMRVWLVGEGLGLSLALSHSWSIDSWAATAERIHCQCRVMLCTAFPYHRWAFASKSSCWIGTFSISSLTGRDPHHLLGGCRGKPGTLTLSPFWREVSSVLAESHLLLPSAAVFCCCFRFFTTL